MKAWLTSITFPHYRSEGIALGASWLKGFVIVLGYDIRRERRLTWLLGSVFTHLLFSCLTTGIRALCHHTRGCSSSEGKWGFSVLPLYTKREYSEITYLKLNCQWSGVKLETCSVFWKYAIFLRVAGFCIHLKINSFGMDKEYRFTQYRLTPIC